MEVNVYNIKGEDTGRKVTLNESIFGIEPNDHAIYLDVKQFMANQRQGTHKLLKSVKALPAFVSVGLLLASLALGIAGDVNYWCSLAIPERTK